MPDELQDGPYHSTTQRNTVEDSMSLITSAGFCNVLHGDIGLGLTTDTVSRACGDIARLTDVTILGGIGGIHCILVLFFFLHLHLKQPDTSTTLRQND
ncbi:hypothetical protein B566_EDAN003094 [Ephemera danica]|nr:hypothetical protein B566_EDAN003094 [Ephemera danica]